MDFTYDARTEELRARLLVFMREHIYPAEAVFERQLDELPNRWAWDSAPIMRELRAEARRQGLWNLFLPGEGGAGLTNQQYAPLAEITGRSPHLAPAALNCAAPDTGNMETLVVAADDEQKQRWLAPLLSGEIRSSFAMTEPDVASSDATNVATRIERDGDDYVINGRKWWITGAMNPNAAIFIVMGKTDPTAERHRQQSMILVPRDTPGVEVVRDMHVFGYDDHEHGGHAELRFTDVRVPASNLLRGEGDGFAIAQARLGPGRIHHCMRSIGLAERAVELMCERATQRVARSCDRFAVRPGPRPFLPRGQRRRPSGHGRETEWARTVESFEVNLLGRLYRIISSIFKWPAIACCVAWFASTSGSRSSPVSKSASFIAYLMPTGLPSRNSERVSWKYFR